MFRSVKEEVGLSILQMILAWSDSIRFRLGSLVVPHIPIPYVHISLSIVLHVNTLFPSDSFKLCDYGICLYLEDSNILMR